MIATICSESSRPRNSGENGTAQVPMEKSVIELGIAWHPGGQVMSDEVSSTTELGRLSSLQVASHVAVFGSRHEPLLLDDDEEEELDELLEEELELLLELCEEPPLPEPPEPPDPPEPLPPEEAPDPDDPEPQQRLSVIVPADAALTTMPLQKLRRNWVCSSESPTRLTGPPSMSRPLIPGGQPPEELDVLCDDELDALDEEEADEAEEDEALEELDEQGPLLFRPWSATIMVQRNCAGEPRSNSAQRRTTVCGRTLWVPSFSSKKLVAVTTL